MPKCRVWIFGCAISSLIALQSTASFAQDPTIGNATATKNRVEGVMGSKTEPIAKGTNLYSNEVVRTGGALTVPLVFIQGRLESGGYYQTQSEQWAKARSHYEA